MQQITLVACGGTIATMPAAPQALVAALAKAAGAAGQALAAGAASTAAPARGAGANSYLNGEQLLASVAELDTLARFQARDVVGKPSHLMSLDDIAEVALAVCRAAEEPETVGVVVTHGTDILEEVAFLVDLWHDGAVPIVFTGAQRNAASPDGDGPGNIRDSICVALSPQARGIGVVVCFAGQVFSAARVRKSDTVSLHAFDAFGDVLGRISAGQALAAGAASTAGEVRLYGLPTRPAAIRPRRLGCGVYLIRLCAAADGTLIDAAVHAGACAVVLEVFGAGTAPAAVVDAAGRATECGVLVVFVSRCERGGLWSQLGRGNYDDLLRAGALPLQDIDGARARIRLLALFGAYPAQKVPQVLVASQVPAASQALL